MKAAVKPIAKLSQLARCIFGVVKRMVRARHAGLEVAQHGVDPMQLRRLRAFADTARDIALMRHQVHRQEPQAQGQLGVLYHGAHNAGALVAADKVLPQFAPGAIAREGKAFAGAVRAAP